MSGGSLDKEALVFRGGVQYSCRGQTVTFRDDLYSGDVLLASNFVELNGGVVVAGQPVPGWVMNPRGQGVEPEPYS